MANSPFKGLLYSPEVLGGIGLLTAGLSGQNPGAALPMIQQGMKTASMFQAMEEEEEKRKFKKLYADSVPKEDKALFNFAPVEYIKNREFKKTKAPKFQIFANANGEERTLNISTPEGIAEGEELAKQGFFPITKSLNAKDVASLSKKSEGSLEETIIKGEDLLTNLQSQELQFKDEFLTYSGKVKYKFLIEKDKISSVTNKPLTQEERQYVNAFSAWQQTNLQYFNNYRKLITGVAAGEKEIGWLQECITSEKASPATYRAKLKNQIRIQKSLIENAQKYKSTKGKVYNDKGEYSKEYLNYLKGKVKPSGEYLEDLVKSMKIDNNYDAETINGMLDLEFRGIDWREILETYLKAKQGNFPS